MNINASAIERGQLELSLDRREVQKLTPCDGVCQAEAWVVKRGTLK